MEKSQVYKREFEKLKELFKDVEESNKKLVEGLIEDAAFLYVENYMLKQSLEKTGMVKFHPNNATMQKNLPSAKEYRQNLNSYAVVIKTLAAILQKKIDLNDDDLEEFE